MALFLINRGGDVGSAFDRRVAQSIGLNQHGSGDVAFPGGGRIELLADRLSKFAKNVIVLRGGIKTSEIRAATESSVRVPASEERVLVPTGRFLGEGFEDARLDTLFLTMPISWSGTLAQYAGRLHRLHAPKRDVIIYDDVDENEPMLAKMAGKREAGYRSLGYRAISHSETRMNRALDGMV